MGISLPAMLKVAWVPFKAEHFSEICSVGSVKERIKVSQEDRIFHTVGRTCTNYNTYSFSLLLETKTKQKHKLRTTPQSLYIFSSQPKVPQTGLRVWGRGPKDGQCVQTDEVEENVFLPFEQ